MAEDKYVKFVKGCQKFLNELSPERFPLSEHDYLRRWWKQDIKANKTDLGFEEWLQDSETGYRSIRNPGGWSQEDT